MINGIVMDVNMSLILVINIIRWDINILVKKQDGDIQHQNSAHWKISPIDSDGVLHRQCRTSESPYRYKTACIDNNIVVIYILQ